MPFQTFSDVESFGIETSYTSSKIYKFTTYASHSDTFFPPYTNSKTFYENFAIDGTYVVDWDISQDGTATSTHRTLTTNNSGFSYNGSTGSTSYNQWAYSYTTTQTNTNIPRTITTSTELTYEISFGSDVSTKTYSDVTSKTSVKNISYTTIESSASRGYRAGGNYPNRIYGKKIYLAGKIGTKWTQNGNDNDSSRLVYAQAFTESSTYTPFLANGSLTLDNTNSPVELGTFETSVFSENYSIVAKSTSTVWPKSEETITFDTFDFGVSIPYTISSHFSYVDGDMTFSSVSDEPATAYVDSTKSTTSKVTIQNEFVAVGPTYPTSGISGSVSSCFLTSTKKTTRLSTIQSLFTISYYTSFSTKTYRQLITTTCSSSYVVASLGESGTGSLTESFSTSASGPTSAGGGADSFSESYESSFTHFIKYSQLAKSYYSLPSVYLSGEPTLFTQLSPNMNFVVGTSNSLKYFKNLSPTNNLSNIFFTTYQFNRYGLVNAPTIAVPVETIMDLYDDPEDPSTIIGLVSQSVFIEDAFYQGVSAARVSRTTYSTYDTGFNSASESFQIQYDGSESVFTMGVGGGGDFHYGVDQGSADSIFHTKAVEGFGSNKASWSLDRYYYWNDATASDPQRVTSGTASTPVQAIGDRNIYTIIASEWVPAVGLGLRGQVVTEEKYYQISASRI